MFVPSSDYDQLHNWQGVRLKIHWSEALLRVEDNVGYIKKIADMKFLHINLEKHYLIEIYFHKSANATTKNQAILSLEKVCV